MFLVKIANNGTQVLVLGLMVREYIICCIKTIIIMSVTAVGFASSLFGKFNFFCDFASSEGQKVFSRHLHFTL